MSHFYNSIGKLHLSFFLLLNALCQFIIRSFANISLFVRVRIFFLDFNVTLKKWNFYSKNNFKIQTCLFTKHESLQGDSPRVCTNILKCSLHSLVTKGIWLVGFATRAMVCESPTHYLIVSKFISDPWGGGRDL